MAYVREREREREREKKKKKKKREERQMWRCGHWEREQWVELAEGKSIHVASFK